MKPGANRVSATQQTGKATTKAFIRGFLNHSFSILTGFFRFAGCFCNAFATPLPGSGSSDWSRTPTLETLPWFYGLVKFCRMIKVNRISRLSFAWDGLGWPGGGPIFGMGKAAEQPVAGRALWSRRDPGY
jgi:hypothetical protein